MSFVLDGSTEQSRGEETTMTNVCSEERLQCFINSCFVADLYLQTFFFNRDLDRDWMFDLRWIGRTAWSVERPRGLHGLPTPNPGRIVQTVVGLPVSLSETRPVWDCHVGLPRNGQGWLTGSQLIGIYGSPLCRVWVFQKYTLEWFDGLGSGPPGSERL